MSGSRGGSVEQMEKFFRLLGLEPGADEAAIKKAYRKRALELHPDKNPDNPRAEEQFHEIKTAHDALMDSSLRAEFEKKLAARAQNAARVREMDSARRKMREELEVRERTAAAGVKEQARTDAEYHAKLQQLRRDGLEMRRQMEGALAEERHRVLEAAHASAAASAPSDEEESFSLDATVRVKWPAELNEAIGEDVDDSGHKVLSDAQLRKFFSRFARIVEILARKAQSACVVYATTAGAAAAVDSPPTGFKVARVSEPEANARASKTGVAASVAVGSHSSHASSRGSATPAGPTPAAHDGTAPAPAAAGQKRFRDSGVADVAPPPVSLKEKENAVLARLREAAAKKKREAAAVPVQ